MTGTFSAAITFHHCTSAHCEIVSLPPLPWLTWVQVLITKSDHVSLSACEPDVHSRLTPASRFSMLHIYMRCWDFFCEKRKKALLPPSSLKKITQSMRTCLSPFANEWGMSVPCTSWCLHASFLFLTVWVFWELLCERCIFIMYVQLKLHNLCN